MSLEEFELSLSRHAFNPRDAARAGDVWRLFQDAALAGSSRRGWAPARYRAEGCAFVVRTMTAVHHREAVFGEVISAKTWISSFQREMFSNRQIRFSVGDVPVASASQRWVHVQMPGLRPARGSAALIEAFSPRDLGPDVALPEFTEVVGGPEHRLSFRAWHTWMDPLAHANHPAYVDWIDEGIARGLEATGVDPQQVVPLAERVTFRSGVVAGEPVEVITKVIGHTDTGATVLSHAIEGAGGRGCADAVTIRALADPALRPLHDYLG